MLYMILQICTLLLVPLVQLLYYWFFFFWLEDVPDWGTFDNGDILIHFQCTLPR